MNFSQSPRIISALVIINLFLPLVLADSSTDLTTMTVTPSGYDAEKVATSIPEIKDEKIFVGKKTSETHLDTLPEIATNNSRQAFSQTPGLLVSEVSNESFFSGNYRGIGDPHEGFNLNVLQDGIPLNVDPYGYPAVYYTPPFDSVETLEFTRGGSALLYGSQPGGALNYITREASKEPIALRTKHLFGSKNLYSTYNEASGTSGDLNYLASYHHRESDGFRVRNGDYKIDSASFKIGKDLTNRTKVSFRQDVYDGVFHEPGGLTREVGEGLANYDEDRWQTSLEFDKLSVSRYYSTINLSHEISDSAKFSTKAWGGYLSRSSRRQAFGTASNFGGIANGTTNTIQTQEFLNFGTQSRLLQEWSMFDAADSLLSIGFQLSSTNSPFTQEQGATTVAEVGDLRKSLDRETYTASVFAENKFSYGKFSLTPGFRLESINQYINEDFNFGSTAPLRDSDDNNLVPLLGLGANYDLTRAVQLYANFSQAFKPVTYQDTLPLGPTDEVASDINEGKIYNYEIGVKGHPASFLTFDTSLFYVTYTNQFGRVGPVIGNTGRGKYYGYDVAADISLTKLSDQVLDSHISSVIGNISLYGNASILNAEFTEGPLDGKTPQYAPDYLIRSGLLIAPTEKTKIGFLGSMLGSHFADDGNTEKFFIPSYKVWDLTADISIIEKTLSLTTGINNIFDENYYSRIRSNGIDPALPRNYYIGFNAYF